ncbi:MAG TPA: hypothetical protein PK718_01900 [Candidatus Methanofastidiosa archaeon]|nr:hypothetical protein [Candidatus Methanofastidiosa archaeon]HPR41284.1 hypothetical protein [Candidatus Methanofastidiosa archaeon]
MNIKKMRGTAVGVAFLIFSVALVLAYPDDAIARRAAFSGVLIGIFLLFMHVNYNVPEQMTGHVIESTTASVHDVLNGLNIKGRGIFLPPKRETVHDRVFVPLHEGNDVPDLRRIYDKPTLVTDNASKNFGLLLSSPGGKMMGLLEQESETRFIGMGAGIMCETIKVMEGLGMVDSIDAEYDEGELRVVFRHSNFDENCTRIRAESQGVCEKTGCPICSLILSAFARSEEKPLQVTEISRRNKVYIKGRFLEI